VTALSAEQSRRTSSMRSPRLRRTAAILTGILGLTFADRSSAEYLLAPGDVLEITALGMPDLKQSTTIDVDGQAYFPVLGQMKAAGMSLPELRNKVHELLPSKVFRRTQEGRDYPVIVTADEVNIDVAQYRPVYLDGDVAKPGAQAYRPGLTVRQAVALAGGYDVMRFRGRDPFLEAADFRAEYYTLWTEFAKEEAHISRLKSQLAGKTELDKQGRIETPISPSVAASVVDLAAKQLKAELADHQDEEAHLREAIDQEDRRISVLSETEAKEKEGAQAEAKDLDEMRQNFAKGVIPVMRLSEVRRLSLLGNASTADHRAASHSRTPAGRTQTKIAMDGWQMADRPDTGAAGGPSAVGDNSRPYPGGRRKARVCRARALSVGPRQRRGTQRARLPQPKPNATKFDC
jgi:polysaccharide biosynthesis/export protein